MSREALFVALEPHLVSDKPAKYDGRWSEVSHVHRYDLVGAEELTGSGVAHVWLALVGVAGYGVFVWVLFSLTA